MNFKNCKRGEKIRVELRSGKIVIDKFVSKHPKYIVLQKYGKISTKVIKSFSIYK